MCHNPQLADPDNEWSKKIREITSKRTKTEEDRKQIADLEWFGGIYTSPGIEGPSYPTYAVLRCLNEAGKMTKQGTAIFRAVSFSAVDIPLQYPGTRDIKQLVSKPSFRDVRTVGVQTARTMRCRPQFVDWSLTLKGVLQDDVLDLRDLEAIAKRAGISIGLGEGRILGMGRFEPEVKVTQ